MNLSKTGGKPFYSQVLHKRKITLFHTETSSDRWKTQEICNSAWAGEDKKFKKSFSLMICKLYRNRCLPQTLNTIPKR